MPRTAQKTDFSVPVEGVGLFVFGRRTMADEIKIHVEYSRLTEAVQPTPWLDQVATWLATLKVLTVQFPEGFDLDALDPLDEDVYAKLLKVYAALTDKERSFRRGSGEAGKASGEATI
jgi:hypothetical protein